MGTTRRRKGRGTAYVWRRRTTAWVFMIVRGSRMALNGLNSLWYPTCPTLPKHREEESEAPTSSTNTNMYFPRHYGETRPSSCFRPPIHSFTNTPYLPPSSDETHRMVNGSNARRVAIANEGGPVPLGRLKSLVVRRDESEQTYRRGSLSGWLCTRRGFFLYFPFFFLLRSC